MKLSRDINFERTLVILMKYIKVDDWAEESMLAAINSVKDKVMSLGKTASTFGVPNESLRRRANGMLKLLKDKPYLNKLGYLRGKTFVGKNFRR